jgi:hypothetical protein
MLFYEAIVEKLRKTADAATTYQNKWLSDDNWSELINQAHANSTLTYKELNCAVSKNPATRYVVDLMDGKANQTGIYRNTKQEGGRKVRYYYLTELGSNGDERSWRNQGAGISRQEVCHSVSLDKDITTPDEKKAQHSPSEQIGGSTRDHRKRPRKVTEEKGLRASTHEEEAHLPYATRVPGLQDHHTPKRQCTMSNAATEDAGKMSPNMLSPFTSCLQEAMPKKSNEVVTAQLEGRKAEWTRKTSPAPVSASSKNRKSADHVVKLLRVESGGDEETAATILLLALSRPTMKGIRDLLQSKLERSTDCQIVDSISAFLSHHSTKGRRPKETQNAVDAVLVAATFGSVSESGKALRLGIQTHNRQSKTY